MKERELLTTNRKALSINLDDTKYGTFAEIGAGQEVARHFFQAGAAAGTIAKSMSAYDMKFSDEIYGKAQRYVSRERLITMIDYEYRLLLERLADSRGRRSTFFAFADTVVAKSYRNDADGYGWMGIRFQLEPGAEPDDILIHVHLLDKENVSQQQALGIIGVNLIYGAFFYRDNPSTLIQSLSDNVHRDRFEIDMIKFSGPHFNSVDNRLMSLQLVQHGLTNAVMFGRDGEVLQPSEIFYKKAVFVQRGHFRPVTRVNVDMLRCGIAQFTRDPAVQGEDILVVMEISMNNLLVTGELNHDDFLARVDILSFLGYPVLISNYSEYFRLASYFRRYTRSMIGAVMGINNLIEIFNERYYENLDGGILESFGRLFKNTVKLYIYPMRREWLVNSGGEELTPGIASGEADADAPDGDKVITTENLRVAENLRHLYRHLLENGYIVPVEGYDPEMMRIFSRQVLKLIESGDPQWETMVPEEAASMIRQRGLFRYDWGRRRISTGKPNPGNR